MYENKLANGENTGLIEIVRDTDFLAGGETGIIYKILNESGDWEKYKPTDEWQRKNKGGKLGYDTHSCVTFSAYNVLEMITYFMIVNKLLSEKAITWLNDNGYITDGYPNFNDWFTAVMSGTTDDGNSKPAVWDSIRKHGVLPQSEGHQVNDFDTRDEYLKSKPTQEQIDKAKKFLEIFDVKYEWVTLSQITDYDLIEKHLKHSPLHISTPTGSNWNTKPPKIVEDNGVQTTNHATSYLGMEKNKYHKDLDHYSPFIKHLAWDYFIAYPLKAVLIEKSEDEEQIKPVPPTVNLQYGSTNSAVKQLQEVLQYLINPATGLPYMKKDVFGPYGPHTRSAVASLQTNYGIKNIPQGNNYGPKTRAKMIELLNNLN